MCHVMSYVQGYPERRPVGGNEKTQRVARSAGREREAQQRYSDDEQQSDTLKAMELSARAPTGVRERERARSCKCRKAKEEGIATLFRRRTTKRYDASR